MQLSSNFMSFKGKGLCEQILELQKTDHKIKSCTRPFCLKDFFSQSRNLLYKTSFLNKTGKPRIVKRSILQNQDLFLLFFISHYSLFMVSFYLEDRVIELVLKRKLTHINNKKRTAQVSIYFRCIFIVAKGSKDFNSKFQLLPSRLIYYTIIFVYDTGRIAK